MNLETLRQIIRSSVQQGTPTVALAYAELTLARLSPAETDALRAWQRRLRSAGNDIDALKPPHNGLNWF